MIVITGSGKIGILYHKDVPGNDPDGRVPVYVTNADMTPVLINGVQQKLLCNPKKLRVMGYVD